MNYKIIQIIPNNNNLTVNFGEGYSFPIVSLALIEWDDGEREVKHLIMNDECEIFIPDDLTYLDREVK